MPPRQPLCSVRCDYHDLIGFIDTGNVATYPAKKSKRAALRVRIGSAGCCGEKAKYSTVYMQGVWSEEYFVRSTVGGIPRAFLVPVGLVVVGHRGFRGQGPVGYKMRSIGVVTRSGLSMMMRPGTWQCPG
jgi:hypothetical protein